MAPHSSTLAWKIPWMEEPGRLQSMGSLRVGHDWATWLPLFTFMHWRRKRQPTPLFLPGESQGQRSLVGCRLWGRTVGHDWSDLAAAAAAIGHILDTKYCIKRIWVLATWTDSLEEIDNKCDHWLAIIRTEEPGVLQSKGLQSWTWLNEQTTTMNL